MNSEQYASVHIPSLNEKNDAVNNLKFQLRLSRKNFQGYWAEEDRSKYPGYISQLHVKPVI
jgi:hypothetical protein